MTDVQSTMSSYKFVTSGAPRQQDESVWRYRLRRLFTVKSLKSLDEEHQTSKLKRSLNIFDLIMIGIGGIIGNGIFVLAGQAAATRAGPGVIISILLAGLTASFAAFSYSELASMIPIAGSSYTYTYATLGELIAWIIGWDLTLEYLVGSSAVAVAWTESPFIFNSTTSTFETVPGAYFNVPAFAIVIFLTVLLLIGIKESARFAAFVVTVKLIVIFCFIIAAGTRVNTENFHPFIPPNKGSFSISYTQLDNPAPISVAVNALGMRWLGIIVDIGAVIGLTSVILVQLLGQTRISIFGTPYITTIITGTIAAIAAALLPIDVLAELMSVGTLLAFFLVNIGVTILRFTAPDAPRKFKVPGGPFLIPFLGAALSLLLIATASVPTIARLFIWMAIGLVIYFLYGSRRSKANNQEMCIEKATSKIEA
ncbi:11611_t:CDS:2 [Racocetra fulgida]|uniref:11611_t:CDS:1 n=1 Tax=Racocetra fulgida TaxID=60492 RepID=A0A9N8YRQ1_9GLOM|nr:11611_t:CDS:2 [Racocetra fulgida]